MRSFCRLLGWLLVFLVAAFVVAKIFVLEFDEVGHNDMAPTLLEGDVVAVFTRATIRRGDVVVCNHPREPGRRVVGRVLGMPGDRIAINRGVLLIDGRSVEADVPQPSDFDLVDGPDKRTYHLGIVRETISSGARYLTSVRSEGRPLTMRERRVGQGYFLLSDRRRPGTADSRAFGEVPASLCKGRAFLVAWPGEGLGDLSTSHRVLEVID